MEHLYLIEAHSACTDLSNMVSKNGTRLDSHLLLEKANDQYYAVSFFPLFLYKRMFPFFVREYPTVNIETSFTFSNIILLVCQYFWTF